MDLHQHYDQLTEKEREFVDELFSDVYPKARAWGVNLSGTDPAERAVDAFAKFVMESRPKPPEPKFRPPVRIPGPTLTRVEQVDRERMTFDAWAGKVRP